jgi:threonine dehydrogenase-like Zn-dependent dehydrogenase
MCGTDLHVYRRPAAPNSEAIIQGHEPCGDIAAVGPGVPSSVAAVGDRVMIHHYWGCGVCAQCRSGWPQLCEAIDPRIASVNEHGGHAEYIRVPAMQTMPLPAELSYRAGAAIGCGTGTAWGALARLASVAGKQVLILGQGPVGVSVTMFAAALGARVIVADIAENRLQQGRRFGADQVINSATSDVVEEVRGLTSGRGAEVVIDTSGVSVVVAQAFDCVATWGQICLLGVGADVRFNTAATLRKQLSVVTSWTQSTVQQLQCAEFVVQRRLPVDDLFTHTWTLGDADDAYRWFDQQSDGKGVFEP